MPETDLCFLPAVELARLIRAKQLSSVELLQAHLAQIERVNPRVNAIITLVADQAIVQARAADAALLALPEARLVGKIVPGNEVQLV